MHHVQWVSALVQCVPSSMTALERHCTFPGACCGCHVVYNNNILAPPLTAPCVCVIVFARSSYRLFFRRNAAYLTFIGVGAVVGGVVYNSAMDGVYRAYNSGVRLQLLPPLA